MSKEMEKLVEEIRKPWCQDCKKADADEAVGWPDTCGPNEQFACDERVRQGITHIGEAVLSGEYPELDEALGVMGRAKTQGGDLLADTLATICGWDESPALSIIALHEEGVK